MKVVSSYAVEIKHFNRIFQETVRIYRKALYLYLDSLFYPLIFSFVPGLTISHFFHFCVHLLNNLAAHSRIFRYELAAYIYF